MTKNTIAIIGATEEHGPVIAGNLAKSSYRLLLFAENIQGLEQLEKEIRKEKPGANIESIPCEEEASWEADIIMINVPEEAKQAVAEKIKMFTTRKIVIIISDSDTLNEWEQLLPATKMARASIMINEKHMEVLISGHDDEALEVAADIMKKAGFKQNERLTV